MAKIISTYCLIEDQGKILLTEDVGKPGWKLPGGKVEKGETVIDAAKREVKEETGLEVELTGLLSKVNYQNDEGISRQRYCFAAEVIGGQQKLMTGEVKQAKWFSFKELMELKETDFYLEYYYCVLRDYLDAE